jgi:amino acid permease
MSQEQKVLYSSLGGLAGILTLYSAASGDWADAAVTAAVLAIVAAFALLAIFEKRLGTTAQRAAVAALFLAFAAVLVVVDEGDWLKASRSLGIVLLIALVPVAFGWARDRRRGHRTVLEKSHD